jgi:hypothetical protein
VTLDSARDVSHANRRRFTLADSILVVFAIAAGFAMVRQWTQPRWAAHPMRFSPQQDFSVARKIHHAVAVGVSWTIPFALTLSPVVLAARFLPPRPSRDRIASQPGVVACTAALIAVIVRSSQEAFSYTLEYLTLATSPVTLSSPPFRRISGPARISAGEAFHNVVLEIFPFFTAPVVGAAVIVAWLVLVANGRWRPGPDWIDRVGRILGVYWILVPAMLGVLAEVWKYIV